MEYDHLLGILSTINASSDLSESNVIEKIKEKLKKEDPDAYEEWQDSEFDINYNKFVDDQRTLLHIAAEDGLIEIAKTLISAKADVDAVTDRGLTPLHVAVHLGRVEIANILMEKGANVNASNEDGRTIAYYAIGANNCRIEIVNALIEKGVDVNAADNYGCAPLHWAVRNGYLKVIETLLKNGANPLSKHKSFRTLRHLAEFIKNNFEYSEKAKEIRQVNDEEYELIKYSLLLHNDGSLIDVVERGAFGRLIPMWLADVSSLTESQKKLNKELLSIFKDWPNLTFTDYQNNIEKFREFLLGYKDNKDLKTILNLERGESHLTILHVLSSMEWVEVGEYIDLLLKAGANPDKQDDKGKTPLHYAAHSTCGRFVGFLLEWKADPNIRDNEGKTPQEVAVNNHNYSAAEHFLTDKQKILLEELYSVFDNSIRLQKFLSEYKNNQDWERTLHLYGPLEELQINGNVICSRCEKSRYLPLKTGVEYKKKEHSFRSGALWNDLTLEQQKQLEEFLKKLDNTESMDELENAVNEAIESGARFNLSCLGSIYGNEYESRYNFTDYVIKKISDELKKSSQAAKDIEVASRIVCSLVSKGAVLNTLSSMIVIDTLEEFENHKANLKEARKNYVNCSLKFLEAAKSASTGRVEEARVDNFSFYLQYSKGSIVEVAKIIDEIHLMHGSTQFRRDVVAIGESEVEIITEGGIRNYTNLAGSIVLTFYTSLGEIGVKLSSDAQDQNKIIVEVSNKKEILEKFKNCKEELGKGCVFCGYCVYDAIERGYFKRSEGFEIIGPPKKASEKPDVNTSLQNVSLNFPMQENTGRTL